MSTWLSYTSWPWIALGALGGAIIVVAVRALLRRRDTLLNYPLSEFECPQCSHLALSHLNITFVASGSCLHACGCRLHQNQLRRLAVRQRDRVDRARKTPEDIEWLIGRVRALTAERDDLIVERDKWKTRVTG